MLGVLPCLAEEQTYLLLGPRQTRCSAEVIREQWVTEKALVIECLWVEKVLRVVVGSVLPY
jgi:hypothetical protein